MAGGGIGYSAQHAQPVTLVLTHVEQQTLDKVLPTAPDHLHVQGEHALYSNEDSKHRTTVVEVTGNDDLGGVTYLIVITTDKASGATHYGGDVFQG